MNRKHSVMYKRIAEVSEITGAPYPSISSLKNYLNDVEYDQATEMYALALGLIDPVGGTRKFRVTRTGRRVMAWKDD